MSKWFSGEVKDWLDRILDFSELIDDWSRIYAFDLFTHNVDRHLRNFLCIYEGGKHKFYVIDHSRAWLFSGFPISNLPMPESSKTVIAYRSIKKHFNVSLNIGVAIDILERIGRISKAEIRSILQNQPIGWLTRHERLAIISWWEKEALKRVATIKQGISNGSYL